MHFDWWTFTLQVVNVAILIWLLSRFLFRPVAKMIADREAETARVLDEAETAKQAASEAEAAARAAAERQADERNGLIEAARKEAERQAAAIVAEAHEKSDRIIAAATGKAEEAGAAMRKAGRAEVRHLALAIADKLVSDLPQGGQAGYVARLEQVLAELDDNQRAAILADPDGVSVVAPAALSKADLARLGKLLRDTAGHDVNLHAETDPALIAGLELKSRHGAVHNSIKFDLERISKALLDDGHAQES
jgi:F-type H+-transporting ATPase subunit b